MNPAPHSDSPLPPPPSKMKAFLVVLVCLLPLMSVSQDPTDVNWLDAAPGVAMEYKVSGPISLNFELVHFHSLQT